jgi:hypothetical protein
MRFRASLGTTERRRGFSQFRRRAFAAVMALVVALVLVTVRLFVWPAEGMPASVSAIVMLAGPGDRLPVALQLARQHRAPVLVVSQGWQGYGGPCPQAPPDVKLICFDPDPGNTRGEAEFAGQLAERYHWRSVVLVTTRAQDTRARIIMGRLPDRLWVGSTGQGAGRAARLLTTAVSPARVRLPGPGSRYQTFPLSRSGRLLKRGFIARLPHLTT